MTEIKAWNARNATASLLTPLAYIHVGDTGIDYFGPKLIAHDWSGAPLR